MQTNRQILSVTRNCQIWTSRKHLQKNTIEEHRSEKAKRLISQGTIRGIQELETTSCHQYSIGIDFIVDKLY